MDTFRKSPYPPPMLPLALYSDSFEPLMLLKPSLAGSSRDRNPGKPSLVVLLSEVLRIYLPLRQAFGS